MVQESRAGKLKQLGLFQADGKTTDPGSVDGQDMARPPASGYITRFAADGQGREA
jgi:hypothetical protein